MKHISYLLYIFLFTNCKLEIELPKKNHTNFDVQHPTLLIDSVDYNLIGKMYYNKEIVEKLKSVYKNSLERDFERPYMWDIFVSSNDTLLKFYEYNKSHDFNNQKIKYCYIKANYEDGNYEGLMLFNETNTNQYGSIVVYEKLESEESYNRSSKIISNKKIEINFKFNDTEIKNQIFQINNNGLFLDYYKQEKIDEKWGSHYKAKGQTSNNLKSGYWIETRYSVEYNKIIIEDGSYIDGLRNGEWNYSPDGPVDKVEVFNKGELIKFYYP